MQSTGQQVFTPFYHQGLSSMGSAENKDALRQTHETLIAALPFRKESVKDYRPPMSFGKKDTNYKYL